MRGSLGTTLPHRNSSPGPVQTNYRRGSACARTSEPSRAEFPRPRGRRLSPRPLATPAPQARPTQNPGPALRTPAEGHTHPKAPHPPSRSIGCATQRGPPRRGTRHAREHLSTPAPGRPPGPHSRRRNNTHPGSPQAARVHSPSPDTNSLRTHTVSGHPQSPDSLGPGQPCASGRPGPSARRFPNLSNHVANGHMVLSRRDK